MTSEGAKVFPYSVSQPQDIVNNCTSAPASLEHYSAIQHRLIALHLSLEELQIQYCRAIDEMINKRYISPNFVFGTQHYFKDESNAPLLSSLVLTQEERLKQEIIQALARLITLNIIPDISRAFKLTKNHPKKCLT